MGPPPGPCPSPEVLERFALGGTPDEGVDAHLSSCEACRAALQRIRADNEFLRGFLVKGTAAPPRSTQPASVIEIPGYDIVREVHHGGQGVVFQATQRSTKRVVAIKVMKHGPFATYADRVRFDREIETLGRLDHPNIVAVHDAGVVAGFQYFVMNYVDGPPLDEVVAAARVDNDGGAQTPGPPETARRPVEPRARVAAIIDLFIKVCDAVNAAHLRGIIHRDLKPSNIRVDGQGEPHVLDFGLAKATDAEPDTAMTRTGQFVGSLPWAAPEQVEGVSSKIDIRTDVYSLGAILFQLLTGSLPLDVGSSLREAVDTILNRNPPRPSQCVAASGYPPIDDELDTVVLKCLAKDRERRYQSAGELARDLRRYRAGEAIEAKRDSAVYMLRKTLRRYRPQVAVAGAFVLVVALFGVVMAVLYRRTAVLQQEAVATARSLDLLLAQSNIEQGRMAGMLGNFEQAEQLLWRELLTHREVSGPHVLTLNPPPGTPEAFWGLWELYRRVPCRRTIVPEPSSSRTAVLSVDGATLWTANAEGLVQQLDELGVQRAAYRVSAGRLHGPASVDATGTLVHTFDGRRHAFWRSDAGDEPVLELSRSAEQVDMSSSGALITALLDGCAVVWDSRTGAELVRVGAADDELGALAISNDDSRLAAREARGGLRIWEVASGQLVVHVAGSGAQRAPGQSLGELRFAPDDRRLADAWVETNGRIWDLRAGAVIATELAERPGDYRVQGFSPDGHRLAVGDLRGAVRIFDADSGRCLASFVGHHGRIHGVAFTPSGRGLWTFGEDELRLWDIEHDGGARIVRVDHDSFHSVDIAPNGDGLYAGGGRGVLYRLPRSTLAAVRCHFGNAATVSCVTASPDGQHVAAAAHDGAVYLWSNPTLEGSPLRLDHESPVSHACFSPDGTRLATACDDGVVRLWCVADGRLEAALSRAEDRMPHIAFDPAGERLAAAVRNGALLLWNLETGERVMWSPPVQKALRAVSYSPDGRWLMAGGAERSIALWRVSRERLALDAEPAARLVGHNQEVFCLDVSADGELIASGDAGGSIRLWSLESQRPLAALEGHGAPVMSLHFAADGRTLVSASLDGTLRVWDLTFYAQHIAGNLDAQLRRVGADRSDPEEVAAWRQWGRAVLGRAPAAQHADE